MPVEKVNVAPSIREDKAPAGEDASEKSLDELFVDSSVMDVSGLARSKFIPANDRSSFISPIVLSGSFRLLELLLVAVIGFAGYHAYVAEDYATFPMYLGALCYTALLQLLVFQALNVYTIQSFNSPFRQIPKLWLGLSVVFCILIVSAFFLKMGEQFSRVWLLAWFTISILLLSSMRFAIAAVLNKWTADGRIYRRAVVVGGGPQGIKVIKDLEALENSDIRICGVFDERSDDRVPSVIENYPKLGNYDELVDFGRLSRIDLLIITLPLTAENRIMSVLKKLWVLPVDIRLAAHTTKLRFRPRAYSYIGNVPFLDVFDKPLGDWDFVLKWSFDKIVALLSLILLSPVMLVVALAVRLTSKGPALFKQKRYGFNNELIEVYKFRSMYTDMADANASKLVTKDDPRVTPVGRFIRKTSLDELPQLFNVLKGDLSLVGPRPHALQAKAASQHYHDVVDGYFARHRVKPGITGWAQINGWRGETDTEEKIKQRVEHDLYYIENWSLFMDIYILFCTPFCLMFETENAY